jgi:hypothetical protein
MRHLWRVWWRRLMKLISMGLCIGVGLRAEIRRSVRHVGQIHLWGQVPWGVRHGAHAWRRW